MSVLGSARNRAFLVACWISASSAACTHSAPAQPTAASPKPPSADASPEPPSKDASPSPPQASANAPDAPTPPPPPKMDADLVLRWRAAQPLWGEEIFEVHPDGRAHYSFVPTRGRNGPARAQQVKVSEEALARLAETARRVGFCAMQWQRYGIPDEAAPTLVLKLPGVSCGVTLWDGEWEQRPGPREIAQIVKEMSKGQLSVR
ncbi:Hypothetical protein A7982_11363 [Minicystis rosea]|nr:Hypothetical protein A7982_11363 [Minicystis rosea]